MANNGGESFELMERNLVTSVGDGRAGRFRQAFDHLRLDLAAGWEEWVEQTPRGWTIIVREVETALS